MRAQGATVFGQLGCATCHSGPAKTDSGAGNPTLDLTGPVVSTLTAGGVLLHDVGTCVTTGDPPDVEHDDIDGDGRDGCSFLDTPRCAASPTPPPICTTAARRRWRTP